LEIDEFDEEIVEELRNRARDALLINAIASEEKFEPASTSGNLTDLEGLDEQLAERLVKHGISTVDDLAELAVDELLDIGGMNEATAARLIMAARSSWFT
ncbi:transcription termination/antitermination protein NusA, partial [Candidatus Woesearchaeota archaeon]|nr:transcription termination/antitermination protein NusA [Candidatus Woesearchaeota archaeon]